MTMSLFNTLYKHAGMAFPALLALIALMMSFRMDPYLAFVATSWVIFGLLGLSLDVVWGRGGFLSFAQTAFYGLGGYAGSVVAINLAPTMGLSLLWAALTGACFGAALAALLGLIISYARMGELQSTILSYAFTLLLWTMMQTFKLDVGDAVIGGDNGLSNIPGFVIGFGSDAESLGPNAVFALVVAVATLVYFLAYAIMKSTFGRIVNCVRIDAAKAELLGYDVRKVCTQNFAFAGAIAGLAGSLFALWANYLNPSVFSVEEALLVPIYVLVGGLGTLVGPFLGAIGIGALSFWLGGGVAGGQTTLILGATLVLLVLFLQNGVLGALDDLCRRLLPDPNDAARSAGAVRIDSQVIEQLLHDAEREAGPARILSTAQLYKQFGGVIPVNRVDRRFDVGRPHALIGPNGAGKSSFLKTCVGVYPPDGGGVFLADTDVTRLAVFERVRLGMGVKNQKPQVFGSLSVGENLWMAAFARVRVPDEASRISNLILEMLGMTDQADVEASALSHGQQQWLDIGMVLCLAPRVVLLDEPAAGMTNEETRELSVLIRTIAQHATVVVVEHDMEFVRTLEAHVTVLHQGSLFAEGDIGSLRADEAVLDIYLGRGEHV